MFDQILKLVELVLVKMPGVNLSGARKRAFAKSLLKLHSQLLKVCENGDAILSILDGHRLTGLIDETRLDALILSQEQLIADLIALVRSHKYADVLNIKLPYLLPIQLFHQKKRQLEEIKMWFEFRISASVVGSAQQSGVQAAFAEYRAAGFRLRAATEARLVDAGNTLRQVRKASEVLRGFLDQHFAMDELL